MIIKNSINRVCIESYIEGKNSFDYKFKELKSSIKLRKVYTPHDLTDFINDYINNEIILDLFNDLIHDFINDQIKFEIKRRVDKFNNELMPLFHPIFIKNDFINYSLDFILSINSIKLEKLIYLFNNYQKE